MKSIKVGEIVLDFAVYPRVSVDAMHIGYMREAVEGGAELPPIVIEQKSKRVVDGFHRTRLYLSLYGPEHEIQVIEKRYASDADLFADAIRYNAAHGRSLTRFDRAHCALVAERLNLKLDDTAQALHMTVENLTELRVGRTARADSTVVPLKRTIRHMAGKKLTHEQAEANKKLSGMEQLFYVNQIVILIESDLLDEDNEELMERLRHLAGLIRKLRGKAA